MYREILQYGQETLPFTSFSLPLEPLFFPFTPASLSSPHRPFSDLGSRFGHFVGADPQEILRRSPFVS